jgi:hypothetical protein
VNKRLRPSKNIPKVGDLIGCSDNDFGIVVRTYRGQRGNLMVAVKWKCGRVLTDPWEAQRFTDDRALFWIMSRA